MLTLLCSGTYSALACQNYYICPNAVPKNMFMFPMTDSLSCTSIFLALLHLNAMPHKFLK